MIFKKYTAVSILKEKNKTKQNNNPQAAWSGMKNACQYKARSMKYSLMQLKGPQGVL